MQAALISALDEENTRLLAVADPGILGHGTTTPTIGGTTNAGINIVPNRATVALDRRVVLGETTHEINAWIVALAERIANEASRPGQPITITSKQLIDVAAFCIEREHPFVQRLEEVSGNAAKIVAFGTNAPQYYPTRPSPNVKAAVVLGPGSIDQAHQDDEWLELTQLEAHRNILAKWWGISLD